jgi:hypothetical protein
MKDDFWAFYASGKEHPRVMRMSELVVCFNRNLMWSQFRCNEAVVREILEGRGWYTGVNDTYEFLIVNMDKCRLAPAPS